MSLLGLHGRPEHAGWVCTESGLLYGTRRRKGNVDLGHGPRQFCEPAGRNRLVDLFSSLGRGRLLVGRMARGQVDGRTVLSLLERWRLVA